MPYFPRPIPRQWVKLFGSLPSRCALKVRAVDWVARGRLGGIWCLCQGLSVLKWAAIQAISMLSQFTNHSCRPGRRYPTCHYLNLRQPMPPAPALPLSTRWWSFFQFPYLLLEYTIMCVARMVCIWGGLKLNFSCLESWDLYRCSLLYRHVEGEEGNANANTDTVGGSLLYGYITTWDSKRALKF